MHAIMRAMAGDYETRITKKLPNIDWARVWNNLSEASLPVSTRIAWFRAIHELNEHLQRIRMVQTDTCRNCTVKDTLEYRITACGEGRAIWEHSKSLAARLRTIPAGLPDDWLLHAQFQIWPPKRRRAILWTLPQVILFRTQKTRTLTLQELMDFMQRSRWKLTRSKKARDSVGNSLSVMNWRIVGVPTNNGVNEQQESY